MLTLSHCTSCVAPRSIQSESQSVIFVGKWVLCRNVECVQFAVLDEGSMNFTMFGVDFVDHICDSTPQIEILLAEANCRL